MNQLRRRVCLGWLAGHFALIILVSAHETLWVLEKRLTLVPESTRPLWKAFDLIPAKLLGDDLSRKNPLRMAILTYANVTGIEAGYGYFAPNIPESHTVVFECHYPGGQVKYESPTTRSSEAQLRLSSLIEQIARTDYDKWREALTKMLVRSIWQRHPEIESMRAFFGAITPPTVAEYSVGKRERTFRCLYVYDFERYPSAAPPSRP